NLHTTGKRSCRWLKIQRRDFRLIKKQAVDFDVGESGWGIESEIHLVPNIVDGINPFIQTRERPMIERSSRDCVKGLHENRSLVSSEGGKIKRQLVHLIICKIEMKSQWGVVVPAICAPVDRIGDYRQTWIAEQTGLIDQDITGRQTAAWGNTF